MWLNAMIIRFVTKWPSKFFTNYRKSTISIVRILPPVEKSKDTSEDLCGPELAN